MTNYGFGTLDRVAAVVGLAAALAVGVFGIARGTWAVGGSDSSCYGLMAEAFARGELQPTSDLAPNAPWPDAARTFAPAGFIPSPSRADAASPICAPGFSLALAPFRWLGGPDGIFIVTPLAGALLVWLTFVFGRQLAGAWAGAAAAVLTATTPIMLFQVVQPMNDIFVAALWMAVLVSASSAEPSRPWLVGGLTGLAILVRPNLALSAAVVAVWLVVTTWRRDAGLRRVSVPVAPTRRGLTAFVLASAPFIATLLALNSALYGDPLQSGYGSMRELFSVDYLLPNLRLYGTALIETELGLPLLGLAAVIVVSRSWRSEVWLSLAVSASVAGVYLVYRPFHEWWYLRFLLPAIVPLIGMAAVVLATVPRVPVRPALRPFLMLATTGLVGLVALFGIDTARDRQVFDLEGLERRFRTSGEIARERLPAHSVFITVWQSGTFRFHASRPSVLWDSLDPGWLDRAVLWFADRGLEPYIVVERWEEPLFRKRFASHSVLGDLDWPPRYDIERQVRIFKPSDRAIYMKGGNIRTENVVHR